MEAREDGREFGEIGDPGEQGERPRLRGASSQKQHGGANSGSAGGERADGQLDHPVHRPVCQQRRSQRAELAIGEEPLRHEHSDPASRPCQPDEAQQERRLDLPVATRVDHGELGAGKQLPPGQAGQRGRVAEERRVGHRVSIAPAVERRIADHQIISGGGHAVRLDLGQAILLENRRLPRICRHAARALIESERSSTVPHGAAVTFESHEQPRPSPLRFDQKGPLAAARVDYRPARLEAHEVVHETNDFRRREELAGLFLPE